jgi:hypothetical protein
MYLSASAKIEKIFTTRFARGTKATEIPTLMNEMRILDAIHNAFLCVLRVSNDLEQVEREPRWRGISAMLRCAVRNLHIEEGNPPFPFSIIKILAYFFTEI